jgi:hypothetical protein
MEFNHKIKHQINFTNLVPLPKEETPVISNPIVLKHTFRHQQLSNASGMRQTRVLTSKE